MDREARTPHLLRLESGEELRTLPLQEGRLIVGRCGSADIRIGDAAASREHLALHVGEEVRVEDLGSRNGTFLGGRRLRGQASWQPGEPLLVGSTSLTLVHGTRGEGWRTSVLPPRFRTFLSRRFALGAGILSIIALFLAIALSAGGSAVSGGTLRLKAGEARGKAIGWGQEVDIRARRFEVEWIPQRGLGEVLVWLRLGVDAPDSGLELTLNGLRLASWAGGGEAMRRLLLPSELLREGPNLLAIEALADEAWAVWDLRVEEEPRPRCSREDCVDEASRLILQGRENAERQSIDPGNGFSAWMAFRRARALLEGLDPKPALYATAVGLLEEAEAELGAECRRLRFGIVQSLAFGRGEQALRIARRMLRAFPSGEHPCHGRALDLIERLEAAGGQ